ncbi:MAG TPA: hypothetical protein VNZ44_03290, partial [Pyrinomonadaceae bacterium]|nr:hypothetical protein [Pyrinomonadaceae bacterium]
MKTSHPPNLSRVRFTSFLLCCALALQLFVPAAARLSGDVKTAPPRGAATALKPAAKRQGAARPGELLVRFRWDAPAREVDALVESKGLRRAGSLRGDSNVERLAAAPGMDADALIAELRLNPLVELAEPNFLIFADQLAPAQP